MVWNLKTTSTTDINLGGGGVKGGDGVFKGTSTEHPGSVETEVLIHNKYGGKLNLSRADLLMYIVSF